MAGGVCKIGLNAIAYSRGSFSCFKLKLLSGDRCLARCSNPVFGGDNLILQNQPNSFSNQPSYM